jgi:hypothetical protein
MKIARTLRWAFWAGLGGAGCASVIVLLFPYLRGSLAVAIFFSANRLGLFIANRATSLLFRGDRISYPIISISEFSNIVLLLATGLQTALIGAVISVILNRRK